jgi:alpha-L-fucosidase
MKRMLVSCLAVSISLACYSTVAKNSKNTLALYDDESRAVLSVNESQRLQGLEGTFPRPQYQVADKNFTKEWQGLAKHNIPEWLIDAKFGIYTHWGVYSVPAHETNVYVKHMYDTKDPQGIYDHHVKEYGDPTEFGYTKFVEQFKAEKYDPKEMLQLMIDAGAKFGGLGTVHHDGFLMWDSEINRWNAGKMGPKRDLYGEFVAEARKQDDFKVVASFHHARTWGMLDKIYKKNNFTDEEKKQLDIYNPEYDDFFVSERSTKMTVDQFAQQWHDKIVEVVDKYAPDLFFFDGINRTSENSPEHLVIDALEHFYDQGKDVAVVNKLPGGKIYNFPEGIGIKAYENGRDMPPDVSGYFLVDRAISYPWTYVKDKKYKLTANYHIDTIMDMISRGGIYLLSLTPMASGEIAQAEKEIFLNIGKWMKVNGEAIYNTRRWTIPAEGPGSTWTVGKKKKTAKTAKKKLNNRFIWSYNDVKEGEIRFTQSKDKKTLFAMSLTWPKSGKVTIESLNKTSPYYKKAIKTVEMLGYGAVSFTRTTSGLEITLPEQPSSVFDYGMSFKIK